jgi:hypothetical protein
MFPSTLKASACRGTPQRLPLAALLVALTMAAPLTAAAAEAMTVVRDRETGELRAPNATEMAALKAAETQAAKSRTQQSTRSAPTEIQHANGAVEMTLDDSSTMYSVATRNADGTVALQCLPAAEAQKVVKTGKTAVASKTVRKVSHDH